MLDEKQQTYVFAYLKQLESYLIQANSSIPVGQIMRIQSEAIELLVHVRFEYIYSVAEYYWDEAYKDNVLILDKIEGALEQIMDDAMPILVQYFLLNPLESKKGIDEKAKAMDGIVDKFAGIYKILYNCCL